MLWSFLFPLLREMILFSPRSLTDKSKFLLSKDQIDYRGNQHDALNINPISLVTAIFSPSYLPFFLKIERRWWSTLWRLSSIGKNKVSSYRLVDGVFYKFILIAIVYDVLRLGWWCLHITLRAGGIRQTFGKVVFIHIMGKLLTKIILFVSLSSSRASKFQDIFLNWDYSGHWPPFYSCSPNLIFWIFFYLTTSWFLLFLQLITVSSTFVPKFEASVFSSWRICWVIWI